ncbi:MAG: translation initiation factor IF-2 [Oscillospiraceae bacterium]|nr:translation initiation factor IF-2 [Oscillospiraceae bacterium]
MEQKFKLRDAAKELGIEPAEIVTIVKDCFGTEKKLTGTIISDELNVVFEKVLNEKAKGDIKAYFDSKPEESASKKAKTAKPRAKLKKAEKLDEAGNVGDVEVAKPTHKDKLVQSVKEISKKATTTKSAIKAETPEISSTIRRERVMREEAGSKTKVAPKSPKLTRQPIGDLNPIFGKPGMPERRSKPAAAKTETHVSAGTKTEKPSVARVQAEVVPLTPREVVKEPVVKAPKKKMVPKEVKAAVDISTVKVNDPPKQKQKGEAVQRGEQIVKRVDTRGNYVELDKYNEKYQEIAAQQRNTQASWSQNTGRPASFGGGRGGKSRFGGGGRFNNRKQPPRKQAPETEAEKAVRLELEKARSKQLEILIPDNIIISELASRLKVKASSVIKRLMILGIMANQNQTIDFDTATIVAEELGAKVEKEVIVTVEERLFEDIEDTDENLVERSPVVVVMGHVDHGKTSLLDSIRNTDVASGEAGGITQHIGAHRVTTANKKKITFLDTPGHEAFTSMRARGANVTDIAILVVAADDGIMPQTIESINHARAANVSIIVAINKIDKEGANPAKIKQALTEHGLVIEEWGGDVICCEVSAKKRIGIENLLDMVNLTAEVLDLKANPDRLAIGTVVEARLDKGRGPVATLLVQKGTLNTGDTIIAGTSVGRVRVMLDSKGRSAKKAGPSVPVEITGLAEVPSAGDQFSAVADEKLARELVEQRKHEAKEAQFSEFQKVTLDNLFSHIEEGLVKELPIIVKADVQGSVEAVRQSLEKLSVEEIKIRVIHGGVGAVSESDVMLANASGAIIVGFNVRPHPAAAENAKRDDVEIRTYRIIYDAIEEIETAMKGMLAPKFKEVEMARIEVREVYKITGVGAVAGCYVLDGKVTRACEIRVVRDGIVVAEDKISTLKRFKDDVKEVASGYECGITLEKFSDIKEKDIFEAYIMEQIEN